MERIDASCHNVLVSLIAIRLLAPSKRYNSIANFLGHQSIFAAVFAGVISTYASPMGEVHTCDCWLHQKYIDVRDQTLL